MVEVAARDGRTRQKPLRCTRRCWSQRDQHHHRANAVHFFFFALVLGFSAPANRAGAEFGVRFRAEMPFVHEAWRARP